VRRGSPLHQCRDDGNLELYPHLGFVEVDRRVDEGFDRVYFAKAVT